MASTLKINTLTGVSTAGSIAVTGEGNSTTTNLQQGLAKAWAFADHLTDDVIDNGFNTTTLTDTSTGVSEVNIASAMQNVTQVTQITSYRNGAAQVAGNNGISMTSTTACKVVTMDTGAASTSKEDAEYGLTLHGDLA
tara:strand:- start:241 stop:654 length:414 start_codon:yes stop_codon:yes gene_type:complete